MYVKVELIPRILRNLSPNGPRLEAEYNDDRLSGESFNSKSPAVCNDILFVDLDHYYITILH